jgi:hypothetical protein
VFNILNLLNFEIIVFNGGFVFQLGDRLLDPVLVEARKCMNAVYGVDDNKIPIVVGQLPNPVLFGACRMAIEGENRPVEHGRQEMLAALAAGLKSDDHKLLDEVYEFGAALPIGGHPDSDYYEDKLRPLRDRGLIRLDGRSFRKSNTFAITLTGRILVESHRQSARRPAA